MMLFWVILIVPWALEITLNSRSLESLFGAILWGAAIVVALFLPRTRHRALRRRLHTVLYTLCGTWVLLWVLSLFSTPPTITTSSPHILRILHSGLMAAGAGMVLLLWIAATLWLWQEWRVRRSSWERRRIPWELPPLESMGNLCDWSLRVAIGTWFLGFVLAFAAAHTHLGEWMGDPRVLGSVLLSLILLIGLQLRAYMDASKPWLYRSYWALCGAFALVFMRFVVWSGGQTLHEPLRIFSS